jgi:hypothetical protein
MARPTQDKDQTKFEELYEQAQAKLEEGRLDEAEALLLQARQVALNQGKAGHYNLAACLNLLSAVCAETNRMSKAADLSMQAYQMLAENAEEGDEDLSGVAYNTARFLVLSGKPEDGRRMFEKAREHAASQDTPGLTGLLRILEAAAFVQSGSPAKDQIPLINEGLEELSKDPLGDMLYQGAGQGASVLFQSGEKDLAVSVLRSALKSLEEIYSAPLPESITGDPLAMLSMRVAMFSALQEVFKESGLDPIPMNELRLLLADFLMEMERTDEAIVEYERLHRMFQIEDQQSEAEESGEDEDDDVMEEEDDDYEDDDEDEEEGDEDGDDDDFEYEDEDVESSYVDRAQFYANFAAALHLKGRDEGAVSLLTRARQLYETARTYAEEEEDYEESEFYQELQNNIAELERELSSL